MHITALRGRPAARALYGALTMVVLGGSAATAQSPPSLTLRGLIDSVRLSFPSIRAADARVRAAAGARTTAGLLGNPILSYQVDQTPFPGGASLPSSIGREAMTTATLPLEFLYQRGSKVVRAAAEVRAAEADASAVRQRVALDAATAFYQTALVQTRVATTRELAGWLDTLVTYNRSRVAEGVAAEADLIRATLERDRVRAELAMQQAELARARATLSSFETTGSSARRVVVFSSEPIDLPATATLSTRAEVRAARERVAAATAGVSSERTMILRELGATIGTMQTMGTTSMIAGVSLPVPLFNANRGEIHRAAAERDVARFELATQERDARADLQGATEAAMLLRDRVRELSATDSTGFLSRADESLRIALGAYREGAVPLFQVIDAARAWVEARTTYYELLFAQHQSVLMLLAANGTDLLTSIPAIRAFGGSIR